MNLVHPLTLRVNLPLCHRP